VRAAFCAPNYAISDVSTVTYTFKVATPTLTPGGAVYPGPVTVTATVWYSRLVSSVAAFMKVPAEEYAPVLVNTHTSTFTVVP